MDSSMGNMCLGNDVIEISSDRNEGSGDWDSPEYKDTAGSGGMKEPEALVFHKMDTEEDSDRYIAQCFVNGLYASDGEINLEKNDNLISNDYAVKLCLEYEVRKGKKLVKKELMVLLRGECTITIQHDFEGKPNLDDLETLLDFDFDEVPKTETDLPPMVSKIGKGSRNKKKVMENIMLEGRINENALADTGSDTNTVPYRIYKQLGRDDIMKEDRNITMIYYTEAEVTGQLVNVLCQVRFTTLFAKFLILEIPIDWDTPIVVGRGFLDMIGGNIDIPNRIFTTFDGRTRQTFRAAKSEKIRITESDSDNKEDYVIKRNYMGTPIHNSRPIRYQNNTNPAENITLSTLESVMNPFRKISVWKKAVSFLGSLPAKLIDVEWKPDYKLCYSNLELTTGQWKTEIRLTDPYGNIYMQAFVTKPTKRKLSKYHKLSTYDHEAGSSRAKRSRNVETVEEALLPDVHHEFLEWRGCSREAKSRYNSRLATLLPKLIYSSQIVDWQLLHKIGCGDEIDQMLKISLKEAQSDEEIFFSVAWVRAFNIREPIYPELCREFYATYEFDEVCADDELQSKKIISFRLGGRAHSLTLLEFARRLGLYHAEELNEEGFDAYFQGGLRSDENFNAREY
ncbi:ribonuclease H-like domain-containing protein [Tanacetum coccineum]